MYFTNGYIHRSASTVIGDLEMASLSCLRSLLVVATHANAYGPLADWTSVTYSDAGILLGTGSLFCLYIT